MKESFFTKRCKEALKPADVVITIVGYPQDVESLYLQPDGILDHLESGKYAIDMTTSDPELAKPSMKKAESEESTFWMPR